MQYMHVLMYYLSLGQCFEAVVSLLAIEKRFVRVQGRRDRIRDRDITYSKATAFQPP